MQIEFLGKFDLTFLTFLVIALTQTRMYLLCVRVIIWDPSRHVL